MKTAISIPDETFRLAEARAKELGISRSEFFRRAAERLLSELDADSVTAQIDSALGELPESDNEEFLRAAAKRTLQEPEE